MSPVRRGAANKNKELWGFSHFAMPLRYGAIASRSLVPQITLASAVPDNSRSLESPMGNTIMTMTHVPPRVIKNLAQKVCRVIGRRRNSGGRVTVLAR
jgi:hypothetical protein